MAREPDERQAPRAHTPLGSGREFDLVRMLERAWGAHASGLGDDAAIVDVPHGARLVVSTDVSVEDVHFREAWLSPREIGWRATMAALSDLAAMGATPLGVLSALTLPSRWLDRLEEIGHGIGDAVAAAGTVVIGGDISSGPSLSLGLTVLGHAPRPIERNGVRAGDNLYVTGVLGGAAAALRAFEGGGTPDAFGRERFAHPQARLREGAWLAARGVSAMIDVSDGLVSELQHLASASTVEIRVDLEQVPAIDGVSTRQAAESGEEYELLLSHPGELDADLFVRTFGIPLSRIGSARAAEQGRVVFRDRGALVDLHSGYNHFSS